MAAKIMDGGNSGVGQIVVPVQQFALSCGYWGILIALHHLLDGILIAGGETKDPSIMTHRKNWEVGVTKRCVKNDAIFKF